MHVDPELLGLLALGEQVGTGDDRVHVQDCPECAVELSELQRVVALGRHADMTLDVPRPEVWTRIREELALDPALVLTADRSTSLPPDILEALPVAALVGARFVVASEDEPRAHARLKPVAASWSDASGLAELATDEHGRRLLQVDLHVDLPASGVRQAWLVHRDDPRVRQTLGVLDGPHGLWTVPHSIDLELYPILDISQQGPGETEHSGQTIVRGEFTLVS